MAISRSTDARPLRLWPGVVIVILQWLLRFVVPVVVPAALLFGLLGGIFGGGLAIVLWWVFFSRAGNARGRTTAIVSKRWRSANEWLYRFRRLPAHDRLRRYSSGASLPVFAPHRRSSPTLSRAALRRFPLADRRLRSQVRLPELSAVPFRMTTHGHTQIN